MKSKSHANRSWRSQQGYVMMALTLTVALVLIGLAAALPALSADLRRQREEELIHRGTQYARAIRKYHQKFGMYPGSLEQLEDTNHLRFLRRRYKDPITGGDFRLLHVGEAQLSLRTSAPPSASGAPLHPAVAGDAAADSSAGGTSGTSSTPFVSLSQMGAQGPVFGGGPIIGVVSTSDQESFHVFNTKDHYKDWQFIYAPALDRGALMTRPYDGSPAFGGGQVPAVLPGQADRHSSQGSAYGPK